eukprot:3002202-Prymnesium_polylepis.1
MRPLGRGPNEAVALALRASARPTADAPAHSAPRPAAQDATTPRVYGAQLALSISSSTSLRSSGSISR